MASAPSCEEDLWMMAILQILARQSRPMHISELRVSLLSQGLVQGNINNMTSLLESAIVKELQKPNSRIKGVQDQPDYYALRVMTQPGVAKASASTMSLSPVRNARLDKRRYCWLKCAVKQQIFLNAGVFAEISRVEEKLQRMKEERRYLLKKVVERQTVTDVMSQLSSRQQSGFVSTPPSRQTPSRPTPSSTPEGSDKAPVKRKVGVGAKRKPAGAGDVRAKGRKVKSLFPGQRTVIPIPLDNCGRPMFPITLGTLTVYSIGEIVFEKPAYHTVHYIYPEGFCSTREFCSIIHLDQTCLYTCKVMENGRAPKFEIAPEDLPHQVFTGNSASECHSKLLHAVGRSRGVPVTAIVARGEEFFGLSHPTIQNLIQSCPGARQCMSYKWVKFESCRTDPAQMPEFLQDDPGINYHTFLEYIRVKNDTDGDGHSSSLRTLLATSTA